MRNNILVLPLALAVALASSGAQAASRTHESNFIAPPAFAWAPQKAEAVPGDLEFWRSFNDPQLTLWIDRALQANTDLRVALARYESANALLRGSRFDQFPTVTAQASAVHQRLSAGEAAGVSRGDRDSHFYGASANLSWELDFFGRVRNGVAAQRAETAASAGDLQAVQVLIVSDVARSYFSMRGLQERLRVARENVDSQAETLRLVEAGYKAGRGTEFDTSRAGAQLSTTRARVPALEAELATTQHRLAVLTGLAPETALADLQGAQPLPALPAPIDPGTPGDLLARRPDVAAAQSRLAAATARVGVARADFFPRFTLGGLFGSQAVAAGGLFERDAEHRIVALGIDWSFLDFGRVRAHLDSAHAEADGEVAQYEQTLLRALQETEDALVKLDRARVEDTELAAAAGDSGNAARLARIRYEAGAADLFEVLDAERVNLQAQDAVVQARTRGLVDAVDLYGAMAGGWPTRLPAAVAKTQGVAGK
jgi:NodT family efflux transporter outer membrane factor (OMF) lipoprotein